MTIDIDDSNPSRTIVTLDGRLDLAGVQQIEMRFLGATASRGVDALVDLTAVTYINSLGIRMLIEAAKALHRKEARMILAGASGETAQTLELAGVQQAIPVTPTIAAGLKLIDSGA